MIQIGKFERKNSIIHNYSSQLNVCITSYEIWEKKIKILLGKKQTHTHITIIVRMELQHP